jgi:hypothetical protein
MTPTKEQLDIISEALAGENITIQAFAGAGKTSSLVMLSQAIDKPSLYLAYNKAMADEAKEKFPSHVEVRTSHSLAYAHIGNQYRHKLQRPRGAYKNLCGTGGEIGRYFKIKPLDLAKGKFLSTAAIGLCIRDTVNKFEHSADERISNTHVPKHLINDFKKRKGFVEETFVPMVVKYAKKLWELRADINSEILCTHDTYMKLFQLSKPKLTGFEVVYLDEAQDTNPCLLDIFCRQTHAQQILVGDKYQSIYQWRGAIDAMSAVDYTELQLTKSFRFGQAVADVASKVLRDKHTGQCDAQLTGMETIDSYATLDEGQAEYPYTMLFRTNAELLAQAVQFIKDGVKLNIETDMSDFVKLLTSALALYTNDTKNIKHEGIIPFNSWEEMLTESSSNPELSRVAKIIKDGDALEYIRILETHYNVRDPNITLTTAHKSKGREWDTVVLADDFPSIYDAKGKFVGLDDQERNLIYVAVTRAKKNLYYNSSVGDMLFVTATTMSSESRKMLTLLERKLNSNVFGEHSFDQAAWDEDDEYFHNEVYNYQGGKKEGLKVRVKGIAHVDQYNIHNLPAFIDNNIGEHAMDAVLRGIDELDMLESHERGEISQQQAYDAGIIDEMGASPYSGDLYDKSLGKKIDEHIMFMPKMGLSDNEGW